ncbi:hypothetical protein K461DRAFT_268881 [Myriangium duriaei CBS 260.36]|uniref:Nudix hydrolase domain-containing protein n=1 Tax=Myriangium duriaei CBS 260.36 TaxID=1168546 RepID=A0A9P4J1V9_9PEZI|nr:hypothetical protein K461DRAFT_268881 [Myriangium duriaei CBS 260.36]
MAASRFPSELYSADKFVESAGTVLFRLSTREICILRLHLRDEYVLPKGRRNIGESRRSTAVRETIEETGVPCSLLPVNLACRACPTIETEQLPDEVRSYEGVCEPIAMQLRRLGEGDVKLVWWFVAAVNDGRPFGRHEDDKFDVEFCSYADAVQKLTFKDDREVVLKAIHLVSSTFETSR